MPEAYPDFPHHTQIAAYFDDYVDHFGFRERIAFDTGVEHAARARGRHLDGRARATGEHAHATTRCSSPTATTGTRAGPNRPFPGRGRSQATQLHAHHYIDNSIFAGKRVVVLGMGNSRDGHRRRVLIRGRAHLSGRPQRRLDHARSTCSANRSTSCATTPRVPSRCASASPAAAAAPTAAAPSATGCRSPTTASARRTRPSPGGSSTGSSTATITPKPNIAALRRRRGCGSSTAAPSRPTWSSTAPATRSPSRSSTRTSSRRRKTDIELFRRVVQPEIPNVFFIGLLQPLGAIMPLAEAQGAWVGDYLRGRLRAAGRRSSCARTSPPTRRRCARATWPPSATRSRSTSTTTSMRSRRSAGREPSGPAPVATPTHPVPDFCRHNRFVDHCPICARERAQTQAVPASAGRSRRSPARRGRRPLAGTLGRQLARAPACAP